MDLPLPQPLPEPTQPTLSQPGAYANRIGGELDLEAQGEWSDEEPTVLPAREESVPPPLIEATLVVPGNAEDTPSTTTHHNADITRSSIEIPAVKAEQVGLRDLLQNRKLRCFLCSLVLCIIVFATTTMVAIIPFGFDSADEGGMMMEPSAEGSSSITSNATTKDHGSTSSEYADDDIWANMNDGSNAIIHNNNDDDDGLLFNLSTTRAEHFRQYLVFDRQPQWNDSLRKFSQETMVAYFKEAVLKALNELPVHDNSLVADMERLKSWVRNSLDVECLIENLSTAPLERFTLNNRMQRRLPAQQRMLPNMPLNFSTFNQTITSTDLWETDALYVLKWPWNNALDKFPMRSDFPRFVEEHTERFAAEYQATWGSALQSVSPPVFLNVLEDEDSEDVSDQESSESAVVGRYRQRFVMPTSGQYGGYYVNTALFESMMEIYSLNLLRDIIPSSPEYKGLNIDEIETECEIHVTSSSDFPGHEEFLVDSLQVQFVYYSIWWASQDWAKNPVNTSIMAAFPEIFLEHINDQPIALTTNFVSAGLMILQSRPAKMVDPVKT